MWYCYDAGSAKRTNAAEDAAPEDCMDAWTSARRRALRLGFYVLMSHIKSFTKRRARPKRCKKTHFSSKLIILHQVLQKGTLRKPQKSTLTQLHTAGRQQCSHE